VPLVPVAAGAVELVAELLAIVAFVSLYAPADVVVLADVSGCRHPTTVILSALALSLAVPAGVVPLCADATAVAAHANTAAIHTLRFMCTLRSLQGCNRDTGAAPHPMETARL
jgi:hypothetical protein